MVGQKFPANKKTVLQKHRENKIIKTGGKRERERDRQERDIEREIERQGEMFATLWQDKQL